MHPPEKTSHWGNDVLPLLPLWIPPTLLVNQIIQSLQWSAMRIRDKYIRGELCLLEQGDDNCLSTSILL